MACSVCILLVKTDNWYTVLSFPVYFSKKMGLTFDSDKMSGLIFSEKYISKRVIVTIGTLRVKLQHIVCLSSNLESVIYFTRNKG